MQAVVAFCCIAPEGSAAAADCWFCSPPAAHSKARPVKKHVVTLRHMYVHPVDAIPQVSAWIPIPLHGLRSPRGIRGSSHYHIVAACLRLPLEAPHPPAILRLIIAKARWVPALAFVARHFDLCHIVLSCPGCSTNRQSWLRALELGAIQRRSDDGFYIQPGSRVGVFGIDVGARRNRIIREPITRAHEIAFEFLRED